MASVSERRWAADIAAELVRERRRIRVIRFAICEASAIAVMLLSIVAGLYTRAADDGSVAAIFRVLPVTCAIVATAIPILFFGKPRRRRGF